MKEVFKSEDDTKVSKESICLWSILTLTLWASNKYAWESMLFKRRRVSVACVDCPLPQQCSLVCFLSLACLPGMPPEQEQNVALSGKQILLAGLTYYSCEASLACPLSVARLAWRACLACSLRLACLLGVLSEPGVLAWRALRAWRAPLSGKQIRFARLTLPGCALWVDASRDMPSGWLGLGILLVSLANPFKRVLIQNNKITLFVYFILL